MFIGQILALLQESATIRGIGYTKQKKVCARWESNPHGDQGALRLEVADPAGIVATGVKDRRVYQFRHGRNGETYAVTQTERYVLLAARSSNCLNIARSERRAL